MRITAREIIAEARRLDLDPVEHALDLADGFGWDEDMTDDAVRRVRASLRFGTAAGHESVRPASWTIDGFTIEGVKVHPVAVEALAELSALAQEV